MSNGSAPGVTFHRIMRLLQSAVDCTLIHLRERLSSSSLEAITLRVYVRSLMIKVGA